MTFHRSDKYFKHILQLKIHSQGTRTLPIPGRLADQVPVSGGSPSEHSGSGRPNPVLGVDNKSKLKPTQVFSFVGYEYLLDSALVKPSQERWLKLQDFIL